MSDWYQRFADDCEAKRLGHTRELMETRYITSRLEGRTMGESAIMAGYTGREARTPGKLIESSELRAKFQQIAIEKGLTLHRVADKITEHLEARANQTLEGKEVTQSAAPDYKVQQKALEQLTDLIGMRDAQKATQAGSSITVSVTGAAADRLLQAFEDRSEPR